AGLHQGAARGAAGALGARCRSGRHDQSRGRHAAAGLRGGRSVGRAAVDYLVRQGGRPAIAARNRRLAALRGNSVPRMRRGSALTGRRSMVEGRWSKSLPRCDATPEGGPDLLNSLQTHMRSRKLVALLVLAVI